jgi:hypothetical protein
MRVRRPPDARLGGLLDRELLGYQHSQAQFDSFLKRLIPEGGVVGDGQTPAVSAPPRRPSTTAMTA